MGRHRSPINKLRSTSNDGTSHNFLIMKAVLCLLLAALIAVSTSAFGVHTPVLSKASTAARVTRGNNMEMRARVCDLLGKRANRQARVVTFSHKRIKKVQGVNLQKKRFYSEEL